MPSASICGFQATAGALNGLKREFDLHPLSLRPDRAYSPASMAKAYLDRMGILPPGQKFHTPPDRSGGSVRATTLRRINKSLEH